MNIKFPLALISTCLLSACAMQGEDFPSLSKRAYEDSATIVPEPAPTPVTTLPADLSNAVENATQRSSRAHQAFLRDLPKVKNRVSAARGAAVSSESWVVAQMDMAALEITRGPSVAALADIDKLYTERLDSEFEQANPGGAAIVAEKRIVIKNQVDAQNAEIDIMKARLR